MGGCPWLGVDGVVVAFDDIVPHMAGPCIAAASFRLECVDPAVATSNDIPRL